MDFVHTFTVNLPSVTRTLDNSNLSLTPTNFHFPSTNFVYNLTLDNSNNVFLRRDNASIKNRYRLLTSREVCIGKNCARGLGYSRYLIGSGYLFDRNIINWNLSSLSFYIEPLNIKSVSVVFMQSEFVSNSPFTE